MCAVSVVQDYFRERTIQPQPFNQWPPTPAPAINWQPDTWKLYKEILEKLTELDRKTGQPDCEDPAKAAWMREVEKRLAALEGVKDKG